MKKILDRLFFFLTVFALVFCKSFATPAELSTNKDGFSVSLSDLKSRVAAYDTLEYIKITNSTKSYPIKVGDKLIDQIRFTVALPDTSKLKVNLKIDEYSIVAENGRLNSVELKPKAEIQFIGYQRGLPVGLLIIQPFDYDEKSGVLRVINSGEVKVDFQKEVSTKRLSSSPDMNLFGYLDNKSQVESLYDNKARKKKVWDETQLDDWYNPNKTYVRLKTEFDGIALANAEDIISVESDFANKSLEYFHLVFRGEEVPIRFVGDENGVLDASDKMFFTGRRAAGDTTWLHNYAITSSFYLYYDESSEGTRFGAFEDNSSTDNIDGVYFDKHLEKETEYFRGLFSLQFNIENIYREKWVWKSVSAMGDDSFVYDFFYRRPESPDDTLYLKLAFQSELFNSEDTIANKYHNLSLIVNGKIISNFICEFYSVKEKMFELPAEILNDGLNRLELVNRGHPDNYGKLIIPDKIDVDYLEMEAFVQPFSYEGKAEFNTDVLQQDGVLEIPNFSDSNIYALDTINNLFSKLAYEKGVSVFAVSNYKDSAFVSLSINDSVYKSAARAFHALIKRKDEPNGFYSGTFFDNSAALSFLNTINPGDIVACAYNSGEPLSNALKDKLERLGSESVKNLENGEVWAFASIVGEDLKFEKIDSPQVSFYDFIEFEEGGSYRANLPLSEGEEYSFFIYQEDAVERAEAEKSFTSDLRDKSNRADALIITHEKFKNAADSLKRYRERTMGIEAEVIDVDNIYKEFNYGIKSPRAIKDFLRYALNQWEMPAPSYVVLIGDANWDCRYKLENSENKDYVPIYGWPVSDYWYVLLDEGDDFVHDMLIGRIPAKTEEDVYVVLDKIIANDNAPRRPWMKRFLSLSGGTKESEIISFKENLEAVSVGGWLRSAICGDTAMVSKNKPGNTSELESSEIISKINQGAIWVAFYGHGSPQTLDMDGWYADRLGNVNKYSFLTTISCNTAAFAEPRNTSRNEKYLLEPKKGFLADGGSTNVGEESSSMALISTMLEILADTNSTQRTLGEIFNNAKPKIYYDDSMLIAIIMQYELLGDPLTRLRIDEEPYLYVVEDDVDFKNHEDKDVLVQSDSIMCVEGTIYNSGPKMNEPFVLELVHKYGGETDTIELSYSDICFSRSFRVDSILIYGKAGEHLFEIYEQSATGSKLLFSKKVYVYDAGLLSLDPYSFWNVSSEEPFFRLIDPQISELTADYEFKITKKNSDGEEDIIAQGNDSEIYADGYSVEWKPNVTLEAGDKYYFYGKANYDEERQSDWLRIPFNADSSEINEEVEYKIDGEFLTNLNIDGADYIKAPSPRLSLERYNKKYELKSARGNDSVDRVIEIKYDGKYYYQKIHVGFNLIVTSGESGTFIEKRYFNTWDGENAAANLVKYLRDTVSKGDWLILANGGAAWRMLWIETQRNESADGSYNSFKDVLKLYGAEKCDEFNLENDVPGMSYALIGRKEADSDKTIEILKFDGGLIEVKDSLEFRRKHGGITSDYIGPAKSWKSFSISGGNVKSGDFRLRLTGYKDKERRELMEVESKEYDTLGTFDILDDFSGNYSYLKAEVQIIDSTGEGAPYIDKISAKFIPALELAISQDSLKFKKDSVIRGDVAEVQFPVKNLSPRSSAGNPKIKISVESGGWTLFDTTVTLDVVAPDEARYIEVPMNTLELDDTSSVKVVVNYDSSLVESYLFNNIAQTLLNLAADKIKPRVKIFFDDVEISDSSYVSLKPRVKVELFDNSKEPVKGEPIIARINLRKQTPEIVNDYKLQLINEDSLKARLSFVVDSLTERHNIFEADYVDAAGNRDTVVYAIFTSINAFILDNRVQPNPFETTTVYFNYKAPNPDGRAILKIYDLRGKMVRELHKGVNVGENYIHWDGMNLNGDKCHHGVYVYLLQIISENFSEPAKGKMYKSR